MWKNYRIIETIEELTQQLAQQQGTTRIIAGGTDLMVEIRNGKWAGLETVLDISRISGLDQIGRDEAGGFTSVPWLRTTMYFAHHCCGSMLFR